MAVRPLSDECSLAESMVRMNEHVLVCTTFKGFEIFDKHVFRRTYFWEADVRCSCGEKFRIYDKPSGMSEPSIKNLETYVEASKMFSGAIRNEAIQAQVSPEEIFCPILGIFYENNDLDNLEDLDDYLIEME